MIIRKLAAAYQNICVVGDDAQSIYAFRGATIKNILDFHKDYPELKVFKLEQITAVHKPLFMHLPALFLKTATSLKKKFLPRILREIK